MTSSAWEYVEVSRRLAVVGPVIDPQSLIIIDDSRFSKDGASSPGATWMYCGALGKAGNCQIGVSVHAAVTGTSAAIDWRLFLPESWVRHHRCCGWDTEGPARNWVRRARVGIGDEVRHREKWRLALDMLDQITGPTASGWGPPLARQWPATPGTATPPSSA
ncbi:transposase [Pseudonocardia bannensis]|uniref:Transposase n=1 Tax=Pseudonocardia bannensis TaxID=630973 RepID=A0A848DIT5_9PSEU|nr:transposase [Pseudonocardia bannensis]